MGAKSKQVDAYIAKAAPFARPILRAIRERVHAAGAEIEETIKWGCPHFEHEGIVASMAAFQRHVGFGFRKAKLLHDPDGHLKGTGEHGMGGARFRAVSDLPPRSAMKRFVREAVRLNREGIGAVKRTRRPAKPLPVPPELNAALKANRAALAAFRSSSTSHRNEYAEWVAEAKQTATRARRAAKAVEWLAQGKSRNWKYQRKPA